MRAMEALEAAVKAAHHVTGRGRLATLIGIGASAMSRHFKAESPGSPKCDTLVAYLQRLEAAGHPVRLVVDANGWHHEAAGDDAGASGVDGTPAFDLALVEALEAIEPHFGADVTDAVARVREAFER